MNAYQKEVDELRQLCMTLEEMITGNRHDLNYSQGGKMSLKDQFTLLERKYVQTADKTAREMKEIALRHQQKKKLMAANFLIEKVIDCANDRYH